MTRQNIKKKFHFIILQILIVVGFNINYWFIISDIFSYMGFSANFNLEKFIIVSLVTFFLILIGSSIKDSFVSTVWTIFFNIFFVGESIYYQYSLSNNWEILFGLVIFLIVFPMISINKKSMETINFGENFLFFLTIFSIILFIPIFVLSYKYINLKNLLLIDVYDTRALFREFNNPIVGYIRAPLVRIFAPYIIVKSIEMKKYSYTFIGSFIILFVYLSGALKSVFIGLLAVLLFYFGNYLFKRNVFMYLLLFLNWGGLLVYKVFDNIFFLDGFVRRVFFTPSYLNSIYMDYFRDNYTKFSHSPLGLGLTPYNYGNKSLSFFVGEDVMGFPGLNANVGLFTEGFVSFGIPGILFMILIITILFLYLKLLKVDTKFFGMIFVYIYYMNTSFLSTLLLTHGLILFIIFAYFYLGTIKRKTHD